MRRTNRGPRLHNGIAETHSSMFWRFNTSCPSSVVWAKGHSAGKIHIFLARGRDQPLIPVFESASSHADLKTGIKGWSRIRKPTCTRFGPVR